MIRRQSVLGRPGGPRVWQRLQVVANDPEASWPITPTPSLSSASWLDPVARRPLARLYCSCFRVVLVFFFPFLFSFMIFSVVSIFFVFFMIFLYFRSCLIFFFCALFIFVLVYFCALFIFVPLLLSFPCLVFNSIFSCSFCVLFYFSLSS